MKVALQIQLQLYRKYSIQYEDNWYEHSGRSVAENVQVKIMWITIVLTDNRFDSDLTEISTVHRCILLDVAVPSVKAEQRKNSKVPRPNTASRIHA